jgi:hypothetical protein
VTAARGDLAPLEEFRTDSLTRPAPLIRTAFAAAFHRLTFSARRR